MSYIDLHVHSNCSDGSYTPAELVEYAKEKGLAAFALTDHDTLSGIEEAQDAGRKYGIEVIAGIEFSTEYKGRDVHIVGLEFDKDSPEFISQLERFQNSRDIRNQKMIGRLREEGVDITWDMMKEEFGDAVWTRSHFGRFLLEHGYVKELKDAFSRYVGDEAPCFVPREKVTPAQAVHLVRQYGGIPVLAHPFQYHLSEEGLQELVNELKKAGLIGVEALYSTHNPMEESAIRRLARVNGLCISGGSDFHGINKPHIDLGVGRGNLKIPYEILKQMREMRDMR